jgi:predicted dehydrogenase
MSVPLILPARIFGKEAPSNTLNIGIIGSGVRCKSHIRHFSQIPGVRIAAVCDIWTKRTAEAKAAVDKINQNSDCKTYHDFRELCADPGIDIVTVGAPDHWHALMAIEAANNGKHIYLEKPFAYSIEEGRAIINAVNANGVILQHGTQQRSMASFQKMTYLAKHGFLGDVHTAYAVSPVGRIGGDSTPVSPPVGFDFDFFTGPAPKMAFYNDLAIKSPGHTGYFTPGWYFTQAFCAGWITAWGSHHLDSAQFALGKDYEHPVKVEAHGKFPETGAFDTAYTWYAEYTYADGKKLIFCTEDQAKAPKTGGNSVVIGSEGWAAATRGKVWSNPAGLAAQVFRKDDPSLQYIERGGEAQHFQNFIAVIREGAYQNGPMEVGHLSTSLCHLTSIGIQTQRPLYWDGMKERFINDPEADRLLGRTMRAPWKLA